MSTPIAAYTFLSWVRQGLGVQTQNAPAGRVRGAITVGVTVRGKPVGGGSDQTASVSRQVELYGPGDVIGIDSRAIFRTEPRHWITNFEANYLPFVEFYDEDFPWRYTPAAPSPDQKRLTPWLTLVVLEESEFEEGGNVLNRPLPFIKVADTAAKFPPAEELWAWAHVHMNTGLAGVGLDDTAALAGRVASVVVGDRDAAYSRLLCPRALKANTGYHAFVIPTFETGRQAGVGVADPSAPAATTVAWADPAVQEFPYYHRWYFRTGTVGDFEYLVRLLQPKPSDPRVGTRDMDVQAPATSLPGISDAELGGILRLGGALRVPLDMMAEEDREEFTKYDEWAKPFPHTFQSKLAEFLNLPADYEDDGADDDDPLIAPPIYGRWHAAVRRLLDGAVDPDEDRERWLNELNLDPRYRVAAGFGTSVVQHNQEDYMEAAWKQVGEVLAGNQRIRYGVMALAASNALNAKHLQPTLEAAPERYLTVAAPVHRRVLAQGLTVQFQMQESTLPPAAVSKTMRQVMRPRSRAVKRSRLTPGQGLDNLIARINRGEVTAAPPKTLPDALPTPEKVVGGLKTPGLLGRLVGAVLGNVFLLWLPLLVALLILVLLLLFAPPLWPLGVALLAAAALATLLLWRLVVRARALDALLPGNQTPEAVDRLPKSPDFTIGEPGAGRAPTIGGADSEEGVRFKGALRNAALIDQAEAAIPVKQRGPLDLPAVAGATFETLQPANTIPAWTLMHVLIPGRIRAQLVEDFGEVMVYPEIDLPMYEPLKNISPELFLPNIHLIEPNSITLLETNQKFIEAYMVGLNHEFARELLWREYPTDQRGSYFRQFWDVRDFLADATVNQEALREKLRDIPELHTWSVESDLGDHDHREAQGDKEEEVVLVIRGELLKKYPTAVIYAHRAAWERKQDGSINKALPRRLADLSTAQAANPPRDLVKTPLYEAKVDPDIYFFGFDLTAETAKGGTIPPGGTEEDPGWFFVIKERPGEPRFGLDLPKPAPQATINTWNDLAWSDVMVPFGEGASLRVGQRTVTLSPVAAEPAKTQYDEDRRFRWQAATHSAELAYILYQVPVLMAVHAAEMLPKGS
ncbi:MAG TPA: hypothetical protein VK421_07450 [Pyrinomonadaceae bacterium]|nr:hypothetical protein [Pyrinomonadaceae bacterium]